MDTLGLDNLVSIALRVSPPDVLQLCQVDHRFADLCRRDSFWHQMLDGHYPNFPHTRTPRQQFQALVNGVVTIYRTPVYGTRSSESQITRYHHAYRLDQNEARFMSFGAADLYLAGLSPTDGDSLWCVVSQNMHEDVRDTMLTYIEAFGRREDAQAHAIQIVSTYIADTHQRPDTGWRTHDGRNFAELKRPPTDAEIREVFSARSRSITIMARHGLAYSKTQLVELTFFDQRPR